MPSSEFWYLVGAHPKKCKNTMTLAMVQKLVKYANLYAYDGVKIDGFPKKTLKLGFPVAKWILEVSADLF